MTYNHPLWAQQDADAARAALKKLGPTPEARSAKAKTEREKDFLHAVEILYGEGTKFERDDKYADFMKTVHAKYPDDTEATCFYALALLGTAHNGRDVPTYMRAAGLLEDIFYAHPRHPGAAHYLIHSFDDPVHAPLGLPAARAYSQIAPDAGHAQHMTSHIFLALGMWDDVVSANETAMSVVNQQRKTAGKAETFCGHYNEWLEYAYLQQGRFADAKKLVTGCKEQAGKPADAAHAHGGGHDTASSAEMRAHYVIETQEWSGDVAGWKLTGENAASDRFSWAYISAYAAAKRGDLAGARAALKEMEESEPKLRAEFESGGYGREDWRRAVAGIEMKQIRALLLAQDNKLEKAVEMAQQATKEEEALPYAFGPPSIAKPSIELLGALLLAGNRAGKALAAFEASLAHTPQRVQSLQGLMAAQTATGNRAGAARTGATLQNILKKTDRRII